MAQVLINTSVKLGEGTLTQDALNGLSIAPAAHNHTTNTYSGWYTMNSGYGNIQFGPANASYAHIYTDRPNFYFNKELQVLGSTVLHTGNTPDRVIASGSNYRKWNNGNLECWGMGRITTTSNDQTVTVKVSFGHAFVNASYSVTLGVDTSWPGYVIAGYSGRTTGGLSISAWRKDPSWNDISYYANGRWK